MKFPQLSIYWFLFLDASFPCFPCSWIWFFLSDRSQRGGSVVISVASQQAGPACKPWLVFVEFVWLLFMSLFSCLGFCKFFATAGNQGRNVWRNSPCNWFLEPVCSVWATRWMPQSPLTCSFSSSYNISTKMREFSCFKMALGLFDFGWSDMLQQLWLRRLF